MARFHEQRKEFPPFGVLYLAAILERDGYEVSLLAATSADESVDLSTFDAIGVSIASSATVNLLGNYLRRATIDSPKSSPTMSLDGGPLGGSNTSSPWLSARPFTPVRLRGSHRLAFDDELPGWPT